MDGSVIEDIARIVGKGAVLTTIEDRKCYSYDGRTDGAIPDLVVFPSSAEEVSQILILANRHLFPVIPRGQGTALPVDRFLCRERWCSPSQK